MECEYCGIYTGTMWRGWKKTGRESSNTWGETSLSLRKANPRFRMGTVPGTVS